MKKILLSLSMIGVLASVVVMSTGAFFSDTETSTGNTFTAGAVDLKVDSKCHYYNLTGYDSNQNPVYTDVGCTDPDGTGPVVMGNWSETDLKDGVHKFFSFGDLKPGDWGEDTISLHVYDNDAWGKVMMGNMVSAENTCTEPETESEPNCANDTNGELLSAMLPGFMMWLDQGQMPGFQNMDASGQPVDADPNTEGVQLPDPTEGDNVWQAYEGSKWTLSADKPLAEVLMTEYNRAKAVEGDPDFDLLRCAENGHNSYGRCNGLAMDGRMVGSTTYYLGLEWALPWSTGNAVQSDSLMGDVSFQVEQHRNNPNPFAVN